MRTKVATLCGLLFLALATAVFAQQCTDCNVTTGECLPPRNFCSCSCFSHVVNGVRTCTATGACGGHEICPGPPPLISDTIANYPWLASTGIVKELASHSLMPNALQIFEEVRGVQLKDGANAIRRGYAHDSGYRFHSGAPIAAKESTKGTQWWQLASDDAQKTQVLTLWDDPDQKWTTTTDVHHSKLRLPVIETVTFYSDHWVQVNANGTFTHNLENYIPASTKPKPAGPVVPEETISMK